MNSKTIIVAILGMLFVSFVVLSAFEWRQADINSKNIWFIYFIDPTSDLLDFAIENHSGSQNFHWQVLSDKTVITESDVIISKGETKTIPVSIDNSTDKKITVLVTADDKKKDIYKNL
jgi:hypothetical protein